jgi:hypothetical protein
MSKYTRPPLQADAQPVQDADNGGWLRDLALSYQEAGDVLLARGHFEKASEKYQACLSLFDRLARNETDNLRAQVDLANARARIADVHLVKARAQAGSMSSTTERGWLQRVIRTMRSDRLATP